MERVVNRGLGTEPSKMVVLVVCSLKTLMRAILKCRVFLFVNIILFSDRYRCVKPKLYVLIVNWN